MTKVASLLDQIKSRRLELGFRQSDMQMRIGVSRQQYQRIEAKGNPRLDTLHLITKGLNAELMLIPNDKLTAVQAVLAGRETVPTRSRDLEDDDLVSNPWKGLLGDSE